MSPPHEEGPPRQARIDAAGFADEELLVPLRGADAAGGVPHDLTLADIAGTDADPVRPVVVERGGAPRLLLFTSVETLRRWRPSARFLAAAGDELLELAGRLGAAEAAIDCAGPEPRIVSAPPETVREPRVRRQQRVDATAGPLDPRALYRLRTALATRPAIAAAYLAEAASDEGDVLVAAFEIPGVSAEGARALVRDVAEEVVPLLPVDLYAGVELIVLGDDDLGRAVRAVDDPVYVRRAR